MKPGPGAPALTAVTFSSTADTPLGGDAVETGDLEVVVGRLVARG